MRFSLNNIEVRSVVTVLPNNVSFFRDEIQNYRQPAKTSEKLAKTMGYSEHRVCANHSTVSDFVSSYVNSEYYEPLQPQALIVCTQTPDFIIPNTSSIIHRIMGLENSTATFDLSDGCAGFIRTMMMASMVASQLRHKDTIVCVLGDVLSRFTNISDRNSYPLIGDGISIVELRVVSEVDETVKLQGEIFHDGSGNETISIPAGGARNKIANSDLIERDDWDDDNIRSNAELIMRGRDVFNFTQSTVADFISSFLDKVGYEGKEIIFAHQANRFIIDRLRKKLSLGEEKFPSKVIEKIGNTSSATIPMGLSLDYEAKKIYPGEDFIAIGFGVGLSWGGLKARLSSDFESKIIYGDL